MGAAMRFMRSAPVPGRPHDGQKADEGRAHGHGLGPHALDRAVDDGLDEIAGGAQAAGRLGLVVRQIEEEQHEDAGLGVEAHERDHADPHRDGDVVAEHVEQPDRPTAENGTASMTSAALKLDFVLR